MKLSADAIRQLMTKEEAEFIEGLAPGKIEKIATAQLRQKLGRARRLRDKYRDLARRQRAQMRKKEPPRGARPATSNANTLRKVQLFDWAIARITARLEAAGAEAVDKPAKGGGRRRKEPLTVEEVQPMVVDVLKEHDMLSFGDLWAMIPDVPVTLLRKTLWSLAEVGAIDLSDTGGLALANESEMAREVDVEVEIDRPAPKRRRKTVVAPPPAGPARPRIAPHHPNVRIRSHIRAVVQRDQAKRDRKR